MNTRHTLRVCRRGSAWLSIAAALGIGACSKDEPGAASGEQAAAGTPAADSGSGGAVTAAGSGAAAPSAGTGSGAGGAGAGPSSAGRAAPAGRAAGAPAAGSGGTGGAGPAAGAGGSAPAAGAGGSAPVAGASGAPSASGCTRELLKTTVDAYFAALAAHDPKTLPLADGAKFTENGETLELGKGLWTGAGMVKFKETLFDTQKCGTLSQAVVPEGNTDLPIALRLKLEAQKITEIETIVVREGDYLVASNPRNMIALMSTPWEMIVPEDQRQTREELEKWIDKYFRMFPMGGCNLASDCKRMENGFSLMCSVGATCAQGDPSGRAVMTPRLILADVEAGLAAGFVMFQGQYTDVHLIKYYGGQVRGVHTILGEADGPGWQ